MLYIYLALSSAALLGISASWLYGSEALMDQGWVDHAFWALILGGYILAAIDNASGLWCQICQRLAGRVALCQRAPCVETVG